MAPPALMDELLEEILLRVPPDDPAQLMRAAVVCKPWCRLVCGPGFRRRYREHHGSPPLLGIVFNSENEAGAKLARFVPTGSSFPPPRAERVNWLALDARHGRVLLRSSSSVSDDSHFHVAVWDPITDELLQLPATPWTPKIMCNHKGAVLCTANGCDHLDCRGKPFLVVFVGEATDKPKRYYRPREGISYVYSSQANAWSGSARHPYLGNLLQSVRSTLVDNALYFLVNKSPGILKYNLGTREVSAISRPPMNNAHIALMTAEGGGLGCATLTWSQLYLWSAEVGLDGDIRWELGRTIELTRPVPAGPSICGFDVTGFADGNGIVHVETNQGSFIANLKSGGFSEVRGVNGSLDILVPFMSFYTPALRLGL